MEGGGGSPTKMAAPSSDVEAVVLKRYVRTLRANDQCIVCCQAIHPGGDVLFTGGSDCALRAWDPRTGVCLQTVPRAHDDWVRCMRLTRDGRERSAEELASLPPPDADRWREVRTLDEALAVVREWDGGRA